MKKVILKVYVFDEKNKQKAMKAIVTLPGIESLAMDMTEKQLTVIGDVDPVAMVNKLRKFYRTDVLSIRPAVEPAPIVEEPKTYEPSDDEQIVELFNPYYSYTYNPYMRPSY